MKNIPERIYLQIGEGGDETDDFDDLEVTWCKDKINENDIEYVRGAKPRIGQKTRGSLMGMTKRGR